MLKNKGWTTPALYNTTMKRLLIYKIIILVFLSCNNKSIDNELNLGVKSVIIPITPNQLNSYQVFSNYSENNINKLVAYNGVKHSLDYFDLDSSKVIKSEQLFYDGPNGVGAVSSMFWHNPDSIFMFERGKLHLFTERSQKVNSIDLYHLFADKDLGDPVFNFYFKLYYLAKEKLIFFSLIHHGANLEERASLPLVASVNIETLEVKALPIYILTIINKSEVMWDLSPIWVFMVL